MVYTLLKCQDRKKYHLYCRMAFSSPQAYPPKEDDKVINCELDIPTTDPLRPRIFEEPGCLQKIFTDVLDNGLRLHVTHSSTYLHEEHRDVIDASLTGKSGKIFVTRSLPVMMNIDIRHETYEQIMFEICSVTSDRPVTYLTVCSAKKDRVVEYNWIVANKLQDSLRRFSDEMIGIAYGVVRETQLENINTFLKAVNVIVKESTSFVNPLFLEMPTPKVSKVCEALVSAMAINKDVVFEKDDVHITNDLHVLPFVEFFTIWKYIDRERVKVIAPLKKVRHLMIEVARRLEKHGKTVLIFRNQAMCNQISKLMVCSSVQCQDAFQEHCIPRNVRHVVAEVEFLTNPPKRRSKGNTWLFVTGRAVQRGGSSYALPTAKTGKYFDVEVLE